MGNRDHLQIFDRATARELRAAGIPVAEIARRLGVGTAIIYRVTRTNDLERGKWPRKPLDARIKAKLDVRGPDECWPWTGNINEQGYGLILPNGSDRPIRVHRVVYELFVGPIPDGHDIDHQCHNRDLSCPGGRECLHRRCANPAHLEPATRAENVRRGNGNLRRKQRAER